MSNNLENLLIQIRNSESLKALPIWKYIRSSYELFLQAVTLNSGLFREIYPGLVFKCSYRSRQTIPADIATHNFDFPSLEYIHTHLTNQIDRHSHPCFIDCGANHGLYVMVADRWVGEHGSVIAFEPHIPSVKVLQENIARNHCQHVKCVTAAVGESPGTLKLFGTSEVGTTFTLLDQSKGEGGNMVDVITLDDYCEQNQIQPTAIKIDVEGFELQVLKGAVKTLTKFQDTIKIICEMHNFMWDRPDYDLEILALVHSCGLYVFNLKGEEVNRIDCYQHYVIAKEF